MHIIMCDVLRQMERQCERDADTTHTREGRGWGGRGFRHSGLMERAWVGAPPPWPRVTNPATVMMIRASNLAAVKITPTLLANRTLHMLMAQIVTGENRKQAHPFRMTMKLPVPLYPVVLIFSASTSASLHSPITEIGLHFPGHFCRGPVSHVELETRLAAQAQTYQ